MRVNDIGPLGSDDFGEPLSCRSHFEQFAHDWSRRCSGGRAMEQKPINGFRRGSAAVLSWRRDVNRLPATGTLASNDSQRTGDVPALKWHRVVKDMQDAHWPPRSHHVSIIAKVDTFAADLALPPNREMTNRINPLLPLTQKAQVWPRMGNRKAALAAKLNARPVALDAA